MSESEPFQPRPSPIRSRLTVVESVVWQSLSGDPTASETRYAVGVRSDEQVWVRTQKVGQWTPLETGWIKKCSLAVLSAPEKRVEIWVDGFGGNPVRFATLKPKHSMRFCPVDLRALHLAAEEETRVTVTLFPGDE